MRCTYSRFKPFTKNAREKPCWLIDSYLVLIVILGVRTSRSFVTVSPSLAPRRYDADLTLFSPDGRLYQVEYVMRAVGRYGCPAVGVQGDGCSVVACKRELPVSDTTQLLL